MTDLPQLLPFSAVLRATCHVTELTADQVLSQRRGPTLSRARAACWIVARRLCAMSYPELAVALNRRHHASVMDAMQRLESDHLTKLLVSRIADRLQRDIATGLVEPVGKERSSTDASWELAGISADAKGHLSSPPVASCVVGTKEEQTCSEYVLVPATQWGAREMCSDVA
jgi:hypothetical protein